jgi:RHS repeat-associated protein
MPSTWHQHPFGMEMPGRSFNNGSYRYGFNGKEDDKESNTGYQNYGMREYDKKTGRFISVDPLTKKYPWLTPYQFSGNTPIQATDLDGAETYFQTVANATKRKAEIAIANNNNTLSLTYFLQQAALQKSSGNGATVNQLDMSYDAVQRRQELQQQYQHAKNMSGATMDQFAGGVAYQGLTTAKSYVQGTMQHAYGVYQGIKEEEYGSAAKNAGLLFLDISPFLLKSAGVVSTEMDAAHSATAFERLKASLAQQEIINAPAVGSALKSDPYHIAGSLVVDDIAAKGRFFTIKGEMVFLGI